MRTPFAVRRISVTGELYWTVSPRAFANAKGMRSMPPTGWNMVACMSNRLFEKDAVPEVGVEQGVHVDGLAEDAGLVAGAGFGGVAGAVATAVFAGVVERAVDAEEAEHAVAVGGGDVLVERAVADAFGEEFGDVAAGVVDDLALDHGLAIVGGVVLQEGGAAGVDFNLELDAELAAVAEHVAMDGRETRGADVLIVAGVEGTVWVLPSVKAMVSPPRTVQLRPPGRERASRTVQSKPRARIS